MLRFVCLFPIHNPTTFYLKGVLFRVKDRESTCLPMAAPPLTPTYFLSSHKCSCMSHWKYHWSAAICDHLCLYSKREGHVQGSNSFLCVCGCVCACVCVCECVCIPYISLVDNINSHTRAHFVLVINLGVFI